MLHRRNIRISMTESGDPLENAVAGRVNGILKTEWIYDGKPDSWRKTVSLVGRIIDLYNHQRPHQSIEMSAGLVAGDVYRLRVLMSSSSSLDDIAPYPSIVTVFPEKHV
ncbi:MAG: integrase core domain-containing protein [Tannerella sp.]|nr:integrase core domain-containing protein [Tannerella sp.]